jgi:hypothetical protein
MSSHQSHGPRWSETAGGGSANAEGPVGFDRGALVKGSWMHKLLDQAAPVILVLLIVGVGLVVLAGR